MGAPDAVRQSETVYRPLVAFDFDGTLTCKDSFQDFVAWGAGPRRYAVGLLQLAGPALAYLRNHDRGALKAAVVARFLRGMRKSEVEGHAQAYATQRAPVLLRPDALRAWRRWQSEGARLIIVSASPELIVAPFGRGLGAERVVGTRLAVDADSRLTGALDGANCRGPEKVRRLREIYGEDVRLEAAYGDSDGDAEMLTLADEPGLKVFTGRPGRGAA
jgi:phosphatidylglycerophosphatase C